MDNKTKRPPNKTRAFRPMLLVAIVSGLLLGLFAYGWFSWGPSRSLAPTAAKAPDITIATAKGDFRLSQNRGKVVVLYFSFPG